MKPFLQLNLKSDSDTAEVINRPEPEREESRPPIQSKHLSKFLKRTAHKAIAHTGRGGMISK